MPHFDLKIIEIFEIKCLFEQQQKFISKITENYFIGNSEVFFPLDIKEYVSTGQALEIH